MILDRISFLGSAVACVIKGDIKGAAETVRSAFQDIGEELQEEVKLAAEISDGMAEFEKRQANLILKNAERERDIKALNKLAEDTSLTAQKRLDAAEKAISLEFGRMNDAVALQKDKVKLLVAEYNRSESSTEDLKRLNEERAQVLELETQSLELQTTLQNKRNALIKEISDDQKRRLKESSQPDTMFFDESSKLIQ